MNSKWHSDLSPSGYHSLSKLNVDLQPVSRVLFTALFVVDEAKQHLHSPCFQTCGVWNRSVLSVKLYLPRAETKKQKTVVVVQTALILTNTFTALLVRGTNDPEANHELTHR